VEDAGPLVHGVRLIRRANPDAYSKLSMAKAPGYSICCASCCRLPASKNPRRTLYRVLHSLMESHRYRALSNGRPSKGGRARHDATPWTSKADGRWIGFFEQFVRSTGVPAYELEYNRAARPKGFSCEGTLIQKNVPDDFVLSVPIYEQAQGAKPVLLGHVVTSGEETSFSLFPRRCPSGC